MRTAASAWNSLEIAKLLVGALTPLLLFALGLIVSRAARRVEAAQWSNRKLIERRIDLHEKMAPKLNDLLCFLRCVGHYRDLSPPDVIQTKLEVDRVFFANEHLFSSRFGEAYRSFMDSGFVSVGDPVEGVKLRASSDWIKQKRGLIAVWEPKWASSFSDESWDGARQWEKYKTLMELFAAELGVDSRAGRVGR
jgi:hypothetical protein